MHNTTFRLASLALTLIAAAAIAADSTSVNAQAGGVQIVNKDGAVKPPDKPARASCINQCTTKDVKCGSEVRRARHDCARNAANAGRDPMTMRRNDYTYFCGHFSNPGIQCGSDFYTSSCTARYRHRYAVCMDDMTHNIAAMRYDCYKAERDATKMCRDELHDCRRACGE